MSDDIFDFESYTNNYKCFSEIILGIAAVNIHNPHDTSILVRNKGGEISLPRHPLTPELTSQSVAGKILRDITGLDARADGRGWVELKYVGLFDNPDRKENDERILSIVYAAMIPGQTELEVDHMEWYKFSKLYSVDMFNDHWNIISHICGSI